MLKKIKINLMLVLTTISFVFAIWAIHLTVANSFSQYALFVVALEFMFATFCKKKKEKLDLIQLSVK